MRHDVIAIGFVESVLTDRATARAAVRDIGEQGEGPTMSPETSHFERFLGFREHAVVVGQGLFRIDAEIFGIGSDKSTVEDSTGK